MNIWTKIGQSIGETICQPVCQLCGAPALSPDICGGCFRDLPRPGRVCPACAAPLPAGERCGACQQQPPAFGAAVAAFRYVFPVDRLIQRLKYQGRLEHGRLLGILLGRQARRRPRPDLIVPVPLHVSRWRERGFNQALELARPVARLVQVPLAARLCVRRKPTPPLWSLRPDERRRVLTGAFEVRAGLSGQTVAIIDDVLTSGATAEALTIALTDAGAGRVEVWAVARAQRGATRRGGIQAVSW